ncbi:hypothetical protein QC762_401715 [Podospora pseudocomata]|uniref:Uncharacterized protein n=1 Tax=Podospora pseudocomata TaxID=2093779 RepID=A0ABR0GEQ9_9PEZI|nr:hypothetical protein QC762_401715 [Podospora pseudocomata]
MLTPSRASTRQITAIASQGLGICAAHMEQSTMGKVQWQITLSNSHGLSASIPRNPGLALNQYVNGFFLGAKITRTKYRCIKMP